MFLTAFIKAVDEYAPLIRCGAATAGNDHRLGSAEAPPAIISLYLGEQLSTVLEDIAEAKPSSKKDRQFVKLGVSMLPQLPKDLTDRNRTSPIAFTGNKFEYRMVGSSQTISNANVYINTAMAEVLEEVADRLEKATDRDLESHCIIKEFYKNHKRVIFNGNGYDAAWEVEAKKRGLPNFCDTVSALPEMMSEKNLHLLASQNVLSRSEVQSRVEISLQTYSKQINVEAAIMVEMCRKYVIPSVTKYLGILSQSIANQEAIGLEATDQRKIATTLSSTLNKSIAATEELHINIAKALSYKEEVLKQAQLYRDEVSNQMLALRSHIDIMETHTDKGLWPFPSYDDLLFRL